MKNFKATWGSHVPINIALLQTFNVKGVIELGTGHNSTPIFKKHSNKLISIEQDRQWLDMMEKSYPVDANHEYIYHDPGKYNRHNRRHEVDEDTRWKWVKELETLDTKDYNMLFVDCFSGFRLDAYNTLYKQMDITVLHDYQPPGINNHWLGGVECSDDYALLIDETYTVHTAVVIKKELLSKLDELNVAHDEAVKEWHLTHPNLRS